MKISAIKAFAILAFAAFFGFVPSAKAADNGWFFKPYVGADFERYSWDYDYDDDYGYNPDVVLEDKFNNYNFHLGARVHKHLGVEVGYGISSSEKKTVTDSDGNELSKVDLQFKGWNLDLLGYLPLGEEERFELIATTGVARTKAEADGHLLGRQPTDVTETGWRLGGGFQYYFTDYLSARMLARYHSYSGDNAWSLGVGLNFHL